MKVDNKTMVQSLCSCFSLPNMKRKMVRFRDNKKLHQMALVVLSAAMLAAIISLALKTSGIRKKTFPERDKTSDAVFKIRQRRIAQVCASSKIPGRVQGVFTHTSGVLYCPVPKAGCTFWKSVFHAANTKEYVTKLDIFPLAKNFIHEVVGQGRPYRPGMEPGAYPTRLLVVRDPYSRLLSSYMDKFYLPDFWHSEALRLTSLRNGPLFLRLNNTAKPDFMRRHFDRMLGLFPAGGTANNGSACGKYLTFREFIRYGLYLREPHWMPIHSICNPCALNVSHVIHMETFTSDARAVLEKMGIGNLLDDIDQVNQINEEIKTVIRYNFHLILHSKKATFYEDCLTPRELGYRLWQNFRWRGYIDPGVDYAIPDFTEPERVESDLFRQVWRARSSGLENPARLQRAKEAFKLAAYGSLSKMLFLILSQKYEMDFRLFGFESIREKLYSTLYKNDSRTDIFKTW